MRSKERIDNILNLLRDIWENDFEAFLADYI